MAGPGIRYQNIATQLKKVSNVTLAVYANDESSKSGSGLTEISKSDDSYQKIFDAHDVVFAQWLRIDMLNYAKAQGKIVIIDLYAPVPIEYLASLEFSSQKATSQQDIEFSGVLETYNHYLSRGDFFVCSNERQRDFWVGYATSQKLIKPSNFSQKNLLAQIALCPMGISSTSPKKSTLKLREELSLESDDFVLLWTGGIWDWFDAQVVINAVKKLNDPKIKLVFLGTKHPNDIYKEEMRESLAARDLSDKLNLTNKNVFFRDGWVPYDERAAYFLDADVAIYADRESLETRFSHRTRVLDHIWTELPTICSRGDYMAEIIERYGFGLIVDDRTPTQFAEAINKLRSDSELILKIKNNLKNKKNLFTWEQTLEPLTSYVGQLQPGQKSNLGNSIRDHETPSRLKMRSRVKKAAKILIKGH
jgi:glycosyltransferase involved in cell wall biosynthesis